MRAPKYVLPSLDTHFAKPAREGRYQRQITLLGMSFALHFDTAVDVGAHVGFVANDMAKFFEEVYAFEPEPENFRCLKQNAAKNVHLMKFALSDREGMAGLTTPSRKNSGAWELAEGDAVNVRTLDSFELDVDLIKVDTQGHEERVIKGSRETIMKCRPVVVCEYIHYKDQNDDLFFLMDSMDYTPMANVKKNMVFIPKERKLYMGGQ